MWTFRLAITWLFLIGCGTSSQPQAAEGGSGGLHSEAGNGGHAAPSAGAQSMMMRGGAGGAGGAAAMSGTGGAMGASGHTAADSGAGGAAAGSGGANAAAGSGGAPATKCTGLFCEDFEGGELDKSVWTRTELSNGNSAQVAKDRVAHGQYAMHFHAQGGSRFSMILHDGLPEPLRKHYFGRLYFYATGFPTESGGHTAFITSSNTLSGFPDQDHHLEVASYYESSGPTWQMTYWTGDGPEYIGSGGMIPVAKWFCLEWEFDDEPDAIEIWVDGDAKQGASFRDIHNGASGLLGSMTALGLGFRTWHPMGAPDIDLYMDDIVLDDKRVGCLP